MFLHLFSVGNIVRYNKICQWFSSRTLYTHFVSVFFVEWAKLKEAKLQQAEGGLLHTIKVQENHSSAKSSPAHTVLDQII